MGGKRKGAFCESMEGGGGGGGLQNKSGELKSGELKKKPRFSQQQKKFYFFLLSQLQTRGRALAWAVGAQASFAAELRHHARRLC